MSLELEKKKLIDLLKESNFDGVINYSKKLIKQNIVDTDIFNVIGLAYQNLKYYEKSIDSFKKSIDLDNKNFVSLNNLAVSYKAINKLKLSDQTYKKCIKIKPDYIQSILNYANLKELLNEDSEAINLYLDLLKINPEFNKNYILSKLSKLYLYLGNNKSAREYALKFISLNPDHAHGYYLLSDLIDPEKDKNIFFKMKQIYNKKNLPKNDKIEIAFSLGRIYDKSKNYRDAYLCFTDGNNIKKSTLKYQTKDVLNLSNSIKKIFTNLDIYNLKKKISEKRIIFICGMPRSGTTLVEQIISSHNLVFPTGENIFLSNFIQKNYMNNFLLNEDKILKDIFSQENKIQEFVLNSFNEFNYNSNIYTDKSLTNFFWVGFIKIFFPNAKIIFTDRNSKDVCLSIFKINFKNGFMNFAYSQKDIVDFYNNYVDMVTFWKKIFKDEIYHINYDNLINNSEEEIKNLIKFCDLDWDSNCLEHHKNSSVIKTASKNQARKPIYKSSRNTNLNYSKYLEEMFLQIKN